MTSSQNNESYVPAYDAFPSKWDEAGPFLVEHLKKITNSLNVKEIGFYTTEQALSGKSLYPSPSIPANEATSENYRSIFRKVINSGALVAGLNQFAHEIQVDD